MAFSYTECSKYTEALLKHFCPLGGRHSTEVSICASHPAVPGSIPGIPNVFSMLWRFIYGATAKSNGQRRLNNVDRTQLVLVSDDLVLQKHIAVIDSD